MRIRQKKVAESIKKAVADIFLRDLNDPRIRLATVNRVEISGDLQNAKVFVSILGEPAEQRTVFRGIESASGFIRNELANRVSLRFVPNLNFILDHSTEKAMEITNLIDEISAERREREGEDEDKDEV
ncbi:MAG: 30S ribosome-binding factor RbfA [Planctomycetota bacterium]|nr:MAG: 30S ribosome-binding factor RbfA [Planctomycetota bacterium]